jgi:hypothetical protein
MSNVQETPVSITFVLDSKSPRPRIRIEGGTWSEMEIMPPDRFFELCAEYWKKKETTHERS